MSKAKEMILMFSYLDILISPGRTKNNKLLHKKRRS